MNRNERELVYAVVKNLVAEAYPSLPDLEPPRFVFDASVENIVQGTFPAVGINHIHTKPQKRIGARVDFAETEAGGQRYEWRESGRYNMTCQIGLYAVASSKIPNHIVFLREWTAAIEKSIVDLVYFETIGDPVPNERVKISSAADPYKQHGKLVASSKLTLDIEGKLLTATPIPAQVPPVRRPRIIVSSKLD